MIRGVYPFEFSVTVGAETYLGNLPHCTPGPLMSRHDKLHLLHILPRRKLVL